MQRQVTRCLLYTARCVEETGLVRAGGGLPEAIAEALSDPRVEFVQASNVLAGCYSFTATRA